MLGTAGATLVVLALAGDPLASERVRQVLQEERCQTELPLLEATAEAVPPPAASPRLPVEPISLPPPPTSLLPLALVAGLLVAGILVVLILRLPPASPVPPPSEPSVAGAAPRRPSRAPARQDPDRLAREGRFGEAIHALLIRAFAELEGGGRPALTSREFLRGAKLGKEARAALGALVAAVEWGYFGARPVGPAEYEASLAEYRRLQKAWRGRE